MNVVIILIFASLVVGGSAKISLGLRDGEGSIIANVWSPLVTTFNFVSFQQLLSPACLQTTCPLSKVNPSLCPALCSPNPVQFQALLNTVVSCYQKPFCGINLQSQTLNNVYEPLSVPGYNGSCVLTGSNATVTTPLVPPIAFTVLNWNQSDTELGYAVNVIVRYNWQGLVINCTSDEVSNSNRAPGLIQQIGCYVFGGVGFIANLLKLNCNSNVASNNFYGNIQFQDIANLTIFYRINKDLGVGEDLVDNIVYGTLSNLGGAVPSNWVPEISSALQTLVNSFGFQLTYYYSIYNTATQLFENIIVPACNQTKCNA